MDLWDAAGAAGATLVACGLYGAFGWPWACVWSGGLILVLYCIRELRGGV